jgi:hypothetical protein
MVWRIHFTALLAVPREHLLVEMEFTDRQHKLPAAGWAMAGTGGQARLQGSAVLHVLTPPGAELLHAG